jgi:hypothetical protein
MSLADRVILVRARHIVMAAKEAAGATLNWLADLPYDSRGRLHSKEHELAMLSVSWASDPVHDAVLAHEIEVARQRRRAASEVAPGVAAETRLGTPSRVARRDRRGLVRFGRASRVADGSLRREVSSPLPTDF